MSKMISLIKVLGSMTPISAPLVQVLSEIESHRLEKRLVALEDPIAQIHEDVTPLSRFLFEHLEKSETQSLRLSDSDFKKYRKAIVRLSSQGFVKVPNVYPRTNELRVEDSMLIYMLAQYRPLQLESLVQEIDDLDIGETVSVSDYCSKLGLNQLFVIAVLKAYELAGQGNCSGGLQVKHYKSKA